METKHTPEPWRWLTYPSGLLLLVAPNRAVIHCPDAPIAITDGDKALIAAAPELLAALEKCVAMLQHVAKAQPDVWFGFDCLNDALAALAKADPNNYPTSERI